MQSDVYIIGGAIDIDHPVNDGGFITGTLKYIDSGELADDFGAGNFMALKFTNIDPTSTSVRVGIEPNLIEIIDKPDKNGVFKITDTENQVFKVIQSNSKQTKTQTFNLMELTLESE